MTPQSSQTYQIPNVEGELTPAEAQAWLDAANDAPNYAEHQSYGPRALTFVTNVLSDWSDYMRPLHQRWRATLYNLAGNTTERGGPEDVHVPEIYKAVETIVPRVEEIVLEKDPWFDGVPRRQEHKDVTDTALSYMDFLTDQGQLADTIQPAARNMLVTQIAPWYVRWENKVQRRKIRTEKREFVKGKLKRSVEVTAKDVVTFAGTRYSLIDSFDFIIDPKAKCPQTAAYVGHRVWLTVDEIRKIGEQFGWARLGKEHLEDSAGKTQDPYTLQNAFPRDPTALTGNRRVHNDGRPEKVELTILYARFDLFGNGEYEDYQFVVSGGKTLHEVKLNQHDGGYRPYGLGQATQTGHEVFGIGPLDNAVRVNQHVDRLHQILLRAASIAGTPLVFASEDSDLPDSIYKIRPGEVFTGVGDVKFTTIPDGMIQSLPNVIAMLSRSIEEITGASKIQMGQDLNGGTATEATIAVREGNRRLRSIVRGIARGLAQVLDVTYKMAQQYSMEDVEFPVLGKRAISMGKTHVTVNPADLLAEVKFSIVGLKGLRTYGMREVGLQMLVNSMAPFMVPLIQTGDVNVQHMLHLAASWWLGEEEADNIIKVPTPVENLRTQEEENVGLLQGTEISVDDSDNHDQHQKDMLPLYERAVDPKSDMPDAVRIVVIKHWLGHEMKKKLSKLRDEAQQKRLPAPGEAPPEAGGQIGENGNASPQAGGFSAAMNGMPGQTPGQNPGPSDGMKQPRTGRAARPMSQLDSMGA